MVVAQKKDGKVRIYLDPQHLNKAIIRNHYPWKVRLKYLGCEFNFC